MALTAEIKPEYAVDSTGDDLQFLRRGADAAIEIERAAADRLAEGPAELGRAVLDLVDQQTRHNLETWAALTEAVDWDRMFQIQAAFLGVSLERATQLTQRGLEVAQAVMTSAVAATKDQAGKTV